RKNYDPATDGFRTAMAGRTVGCEACHGPGRAHAEWRRTHPGGQSAEPGHARLTRAQHLDACGSCHARRTELTGDFVPGDRFDDHFGLVTVDETDTYHADGQVRDENYEFGSFAGSRMGAAGVHCLDCHQPHTGKRLLPGDALCQRCHAAGLSGAPVIVPSAHTFHRADSPGARCENCHLPQTTYMQRHHRHDHGFTIPDPALTRELGIPNACNRCHDDRDVAWAEEAANRWYGRRLERPTRARARVVAAARRGDPGARAGLLELATRTQHPPYWQAVGTRLLAPWAGEPVVRTTLLGLTASTNARVRVAALHALGGAVEAGEPVARRTVESRLADPVRAVRLAAAGTLGPALDPASPAGREFRGFLEFNADQPLGQLQLGSWHLARRELPAALAHFQKAVQWDPGSPPFRQQYAVALSQAGRPQEAVAQLREAVRLAPGDAPARFQLALGLGETGTLPAMITELEAAVRLDPRLARAWYNLGLARSQTGDLEGAVAALLEGEGVAPGDADLPYARATLEVRRGAREAARAAAQRALVLRPGWTEAQELLQLLR
ncbi:MAG: tetratricopeptide repeat protein, partial [Verrucomicrobiota bacterium]